MNTPNDPSNPNKQQTAEDVKAKAGQASQEVKARAEQASQEAKAKGREQLEEQESRAADTMDKMADATHAAADQLTQRNETNLSHYVSEIADGIGKLSNNLQHKNTDELIQEASGLARNNPGLFMLGSVAVGFGLSRIAKANRPRSDGESHWEDYYGRQESQSYDTGADTAVGSRAASSATSPMGASSATNPTPPTSPTPPAGSANPTHSSTSYLPEEGASTQNPTTPTDSGARTSSTSKPGGANR